ncbi:hypothetical protein BKA70DRAFT_1277590 [Coprinopsis sp. MPI-PUGE-AT-0042]|nr:hypothetical protein BKA70DRAFT_1277590 [Coprinopsis sp. MPI-PUGE-AT-0042]
MAKFFGVVFALFAVAGTALAAPSLEARQELRCGTPYTGNCPRGQGYTCCGPITSEGGFCRRLAPGQVCIF